MRQTLTIGGMKLETENVVRSRHWTANHRDHASQQNAVKLCLQNYLVRPPTMISNQANLITVHMTRIANRSLDKEDNLTGAFKHVKDTIARWVGLDDADGRFSWNYAQLKCEKGKWAIKIVVEDMSDGGERSYGVGDIPKTTKAFGANGAKTIRNQPSLIFRKAFVAYPWLQDGEDLVLTEEPRLAVEEPPEAIWAAVPNGKMRSVRDVPGKKLRVDPATRRAAVCLSRTPDVDDGAECWIYKLGT